jgi:hypothetical protein
MLKMLPVLPMLKILPELPMLSRLPALPMLRTLPALARLSTPAKLYRLKMLKMLPVLLTLADEALDRRNPCAILSLTDTLAIVLPVLSSRSMRGDTMHAGM